MKYVMGCVLLLVSVAVYAQPSEIYPFQDVHLEQRFKQLNQSLRCLVCQNQDLADSNAPLAQDLRQQIYQQLLQGKSNQNIIGYLTARYGDFVLFKPPLKATTYLLWFGPLLFLLLGVVVLFKVNRRRS